MVILRKRNGKSKRIAFISGIAPGVVCTVQPLQFVVKLSGDSGKRYLHLVRPWWCSDGAFIYQTEGPGFEIREIKISMLAEKMTQVSVLYYSFGFSLNIVQQEGVSLFTDMNFTETGNTLRAVIRSGSYEGAILNRSYTYPSCVECVDGFVASEQFRQ